MLFQKIKTSLSLLFFLILITSCGGLNSTEDTVILISTAEQLKNINKGLHKNYKLVKDIDLNNEEWVPIGDSSSSYSGTFDGRGFTISNLKITSPYTYVGLFSRNTGSIENIVIKNVDINIQGLIRNNIYAGAIVGFNSGYINNLKSENGSINIVNTNPSLRETMVGGLVGFTDATLEIDVEFTNYEWESYDMVPYIGSNNNWWVANKDLDVPAFGKTSGGVYKSFRLGGNADYLSIRYIFPLMFNDLTNNLQVSSNMTSGGIQSTGGVIGGTSNRHNSMLLLSNSFNHGLISNYQIAGGLVGSGKVSIFDSFNQGEVQGSSETNERNVGGLVGSGFEVNINNSQNLGIVGGAGLVGSGLEVNINNSQNLGIVRGAGLVGFGDMVRIQNSSNLGLTSGEGGLVDWGVLISIKNSYNTSNGVTMGGLAGRGELILIENSFNSGRVNGKSEAGGLIGSTTGLVISNSFNISNFESEDDFVSGLVGRIIGGGFENPITNTYYFGSSRSIGVFDNGVSTNGLGTKVTDLSTFNLAFFTTTLSWDTEIWDFTGLDIVNGVYPTLKNMPEIPVEE